MRLTVVMVNDKKFSEGMASIAALKAGVKTYVSFGRGPWTDVSEQTLRRLQQDLLAEKRWALSLYRSGKVAFHQNFGSGRQVDTTPEVIASLEADIAAIEATL